jgi:hypothetical protein
MRITADCTDMSTLGGFTWPAASANDRTRFG